MKGASAVFTVTNYWEKMDMQLEIQQGKNLADAAKQNGVKHYIWSSLLNVTKRKITYPMGIPPCNVMTLNSSHIFLSNQWQAAQRLSL